MSTPRNHAAVCLVVTPLCLGNMAQYVKLVSQPPLHTGIRNHTPRLQSAPATQATLAQRNTNTPGHSCTPPTSTPPPQPIPGGPTLTHNLTHNLPTT